MYFKLPSEEDYICVVYHARRMPIEGGVGGSIAPQRQHREATAVRCAPYGVEERNTLRTSGESEAETKRPPINKKSHLTQNLASDANLACGGNGLASDASFCT